MSSLLVTLGLAGGLAVLGLQNFNSYESYFPIAIFQFSFMFLIYFNYAARVQDQNMSKPIFVLICLLKRISKFVFFSLLYFQMPIRNFPVFINILNYVFGVGFLFIVVPFKTWKYLVEKFLPFRFVVMTAELVFIASDLLFTWNMTIGNPTNIKIFSKPEHEFLFFAFVMGSMTFLFDCLIQLIRRKPFVALRSGIQSAIIWGVGGSLGYLGFTYFNQISTYLVPYEFIKFESPLDLLKKTMFVYFLLIGGYFSKLPSTESTAFSVKVANSKSKKVKKE